MGIFDDTAALKKLFEAMGGLAEPEDDEPKDPKQPRQVPEKTFKDYSKVDKEKVEKIFTKAWNAKFGELYSWRELFPHMGLSPLEMEWLDDFVEMETVCHDEEYNKFVPTKKPETSAEEPKTVEPKSVEPPKGDDAKFEDYLRNETPETVVAMANAPRFDVWRSKLSPSQAELLQTIARSKQLGEGKQ